MIIYSPFVVILVDIYGDRDPVAGISAVIHVIAAFVIVNVDVIVFVPVIRPIFRPGVEDAEPKTVILKAGKSAVCFHGKTVDPEPVVGTEVAAEMILGNTVAVVAAALLPGAVLGPPAACAMLLP